jgi:hypothetical protein
MKREDAEESENETGANSICMIFAFRFPPRASVPSASSALKHPNP